MVSKWFSMPGHPRDFIIRWHKSPNLVKYFCILPVKFVQQSGVLTENRICSKYHQWLWTEPTCQISTFSWSPHPVRVTALAFCCGLEPAVVWCWSVVCCSCWTKGPGTTGGSIVALSGTVLRSLLYGGSRGISPTQILSMFHCAAF